MKRIPQRVHTRDAFSTSTPRQSGGGGGNGGGGGGGGNVNLSSVSFHGWASFDDTATASAFPSIWQAFSAAHYIVKDHVKVAFWIGGLWASGGTAFLTVSDSSRSTYGSPDTVATSQSITLVEGLNVIDFAHGQSVGLHNGLYYFNLNFAVDDPDFDYFADTFATTWSRPFFSFYGAGSTTGGGGGGGSTGGGGGGAPANIRSLYLSKYVHGATEVVVDGTSIQAAIDSLPTDGGVVLVKEGGVYDAFNFNGKNFTSFASVMNFPAHSPQVSGLSRDFQNNERAVVFDSSSNCGVYGFNVSSVNQSGHPYADGVFIRNSHHIAVWSNDIHDCVHGVGAADDGTGGCNHIDTCYNRIHDCAGWLDSMASAISYFRLANIGGGDGPDGYSSHLIGNIIWNAVNDASYGGAITDGNGIIIDIANGDYSSAPIGYTGHTLVANNICVSNGGRGVHAFFSRWVHQYFNTVAYNLRSSTMSGDGEISQYGNHDGAESRYNLVLTSPTRTNWIVDGDSTVVIENNVVVGGSNPAISGTNVDKTSIGPSYFSAISTTNPTAAGWAPVTADAFTVDSDVLSALQGWPDAAFNYRPSSGVWTAGAVNGGTSSGGGGSSGVDMPTEDLPGWQIVFSDDFTTDAPLGSWGPGTTDAPGSYAGRWRMYPDGTPDTSGQNNGFPCGYWPSKTVSVSNSLMRTYVHTEGGNHMASAMLPNFGAANGNQLYGRYAVRFRSDAVANYKVAWLLWPQSETWPRDGEIDFPEASLNSVIEAYMHRQEGVNGGDQDGYSTSVTPNDWHTCVIEWGPSECKFILDGLTVGTSTSRIPNTPMHFILQTETSLSVEPNDSDQGYVELDWIVIWKRV